MSADPLLPADAPHCVHPATSAAAHFRCSSPDKPNFKHMLQAGAFADYQPGEGGEAASASSDSGGGDGEAAEASGGGEEQPEPASGGGGDGGGGGGGTFPPHIMLNMPALSPTMESGQHGSALRLPVVHPKTQDAL
jgi:hypothetical protein